MSTTMVAAGKEEVMLKLQDKGLDEIARWVGTLPNHEWERRLISRWPSLAKECGIRLNGN
jgi:hypothetical protein